MWFPDCTEAGQAHHLSSRREKNRGGTAGEVGEGEGAAKEGVEASGDCHEYG